MSEPKPVLVDRLDGPPVEMEVSTDMVKRGLVAAPVLVGIAALIWGADGAASAAFAIALVLLNFLLSAALITYTARISLGLMMGAVLGGFVIRLGLVMIAVLLVRDQSWIYPPALGAAIIVTHIGLLAWEVRYVSASLSHPGLKPRPPVPHTH